MNNKKKTVRLPMAVTAEQEVFPFIKNFINNFGYSPSLDEIGRRFNKTREWARVCVALLVKAKKIKRALGSKRSIKIR